MYKIEIKTEMYKNYIVMLPSVFKLYYFILNCFKMIFKAHLSVGLVQLVHCRFLIVAVSV